MSKAFKLVREENIPELNSVAKLYVHKKTGARLLSVSNDDENKVFCINFRTTPKDSTGAPICSWRSASFPRFQARPTPSGSTTAIAG